MPPYSLPCTGSCRNMLCRVSRSNLRRAGRGYEIVKTQTGAEMVLIPAGSFVMGSADGEPMSRPPTKWRWMLLDGPTEVTHSSTASWSWQPVALQGPDRPWNKSAGRMRLYCNARSRSEGLEPCYDENRRSATSKPTLPVATEAEWSTPARRRAAAYAFGADPQQLGQHAWFASGRSLDLLQLLCSSCSGFANTACTRRISSRVTDVTAAVVRPETEPCWVRWCLQRRHAAERRANSIAVE